MRRYRLHIITALLAVPVLIVFDYVSFHRTERRAISITKQLGGSGKSMWSWPLGKNYMFIFKRQMTDEELEALMVLNSLAGRNEVGIHFQDFEIPDMRLAEIRGLFSECTVYYSPGVKRAEK